MATDAGGSGRSRARARRGARTAAARYGALTLLFAVVGGLLAWPRIDALRLDPGGSFFLDATRIRDDDRLFNTADGVVLEGAAPDGTPYVLRAERAESRGDPFGRDIALLLSRPDLELGAGPEGAVRIRAPRGSHDTSLEESLLFGGVAVESPGDEGLRLSAPRVRVDWRAEEATLDGPVEGRAREGRLTAAGGARIEEGGERVVLLGPARVVLEGGGEP